MADTTRLEQVEPFIHDWLGKKFKTTFSRKHVSMANGQASYEFGAVSEDGQTVAVIRRSSGKTSGRKFPTAKIQTIFKDIQSLSQIKAANKLIVITDSEFLGIVKNKMRGKLPDDIQLLHCQLPPDLAAVVQSVRNKASEEMDRGKLEFRKSPGIKS
jgi:hypothetical protein